MSEPIEPQSPTENPPGQPVILSPPKRSRLLEVLETVVVAVLLAVFIRATVAEARYIPSLSMEPTLLVGDRLIIEKISFYFSKPQRGDILVFYPPNPYATQPPPGFFNQTMKWLGFTNDIAYIKRVVGLPGDTIAVKDGKVLINGTVLQEDYIKDPPYYTYEPFKVPPDSLFMMGDNRNNSQDSHKWGPLPVANVIGKAVLRFWPLPRMGPPR